MPDYTENTKLAIVGVIALGIVSIFQLNPADAKEVVQIVAAGLIGYISRGKSEV